MGVERRIVGQDDDGQRLDRWLKRLFPNITQGRIEKMCRKGELRIDGSRCKASSRITQGQEVRIPPIPHSDAPSAPVLKPAVSHSDAQMIQECVLYRDDHILILNKPAGLPTQGGSKQKRHVDGLSEALKFDYDEKPRLVHRLDKDTSGVLMLARSRAVASSLADALRHREARKIYWAAVAGVPSPLAGTIKYGLVKAGGHGKTGEGEKMRCVHPRDISKIDGAKNAISDYLVLSQLAKRGAWVALVPVTGRTHQLRAHMAEIGNPIIGDGKYGGSGQENLGDGWGAQLGGDISKKLHLHARYLRIMHPVTKKELEITAPLPQHMQRTWATFEWQENEFPDDPFDEMIG